MFRTPLDTHIRSSRGKGSISVRIFMFHEDRHVCRDRVGHYECPIGRMKNDRACRMEKMGRRKCFEREGKTRKGKREREGESNRYIKRVCLLRAKKKKYRIR